MRSGQARVHRAKLASQREEQKALAPLKEMASVVERGVEAELATVMKRLAEVWCDTNSSVRWHCYG